MLIWKCSANFSATLVHRILPGRHNPGCSVRGLSHQLLLSNGSNDCNLVTEPPDHGGIGFFISEKPLQRFKPAIASLRFSPRKPSIAPGEAPARSSTTWSFAIAAATAGDQNILVLVGAFNLKPPAFCIIFSVRWFITTSRVFKTMGCRRQPGKQEQWVPGWQRTQSAYGSTRAPKRPLTSMPGPSR